MSVMKVLIPPVCRDRRFRNSHCVRTPVCCEIAGMVQRGDFTKNPEIQMEKAVLLIGSGVNGADDVEIFRVYIIRQPASPIAPSYLSVRKKVLLIERLQNSHDLAIRYNAVL